MTTHIDDKLPISGDAAETLAAYLEELNIKLLRAGVENSYSISTETEGAILDSLKNLGITSKLTVDDVLIVLNKQGSPDKIVQDHMELNDIQYPDTYSDTFKFKIDPTSRELPKREGTFKIGVRQILGRIFVLTPIVLILFAIFLLLIPSDEGGITFMILSVLAFSGHEIYTGLKGKLFETFSVTIKFRSVYRSLLFAGAFIAFSINALVGYLTVDFDPNYDNNFHYLWIVMLCIVEAIVFTRDHTYGFHPIEPEFRPLVRFLTLPYLLLGLSIMIMLVGFSVYSDLYEIEVYSLIAILATLSTSVKKFKGSLRFYLVAFSVVFIPDIILEQDNLYYNYHTTKLFIFLELFTIFIALVLRNWHLIKSELSSYFGKISESYHSY